MTETMFDIPTDEAPVLAPIDSAFSDPDGDIEEQRLRASMPAFRDLRRMLPAARLSMQLELAGLASALPAGLTEGIDISDLTPEAAAGLASFFQTMQDMVLDNAADASEMEAWLIEAEDGTAALQIAFSALSERLGN